MAQPAPKQIAWDDLQKAMQRETDAASMFIRQPSELDGSSQFPPDGMEMLKGYSRDVLAGKTKGMVDPPKIFSDDFRRGLFHGVSALLKRATLLR